MKKIVDSKFLLILALSLVVLIVLAVGAFYLFDDSDAIFTKEGYVLNPLSGKVEKYFFDENTSYKENLSQMVEFKDVDNNQVTILKESFIHYLDGSMSFLKDGAILDLNSINGTEAVNFYNITNKSMIEKTNDGYVIKTNNGNIELKNFIGRISDDKYIVVGNLEAKIPGNNANIKGDYFEIVYTEEGIINIENRDSKFQVTADGTAIYAGNVAIDLGAKKVSVNNTDVMSLTAITINGNENIEIIPEEPANGAGDDDDDNQGEGQGQQGGAGDNPGNNPGGAGGEGANGEGDDIKKDELMVMLKDASVGSTSVDVMFDMYNQKADDTFTLKVTNLDTGKTVDVRKNILPNETKRIDLLSPDTKYLFTVVSDNDENKYFQKIFQTNDFGIKLEKAYATDSELGFKVTIAEGTEITNARLTLYGYNEETKRNEIVVSKYYNANHEVINEVENQIYLKNLDGNIEGVHEVTFGGLTSDTIYTAVLDEFALATENFKDIYEKTLTTMTLKKMPSFSNMTADKDKGASSFRLALGNIDDPDNAITSYTYNIYENSDASTVAIAPITKNNASPIEVKFGDGENQLKNDTNYFYKVIIEYFDNEKYIEYVHEDSLNFYMGTDPYITVVPNADLISYDTIGATIYLIDNSCLVAIPGREKCNAEESTTLIDVSKINAVNGERTSIFTRVVDFTVGENELKYELFLDNLQANTTYTIEVRAVREDLSSTDKVEIQHTEDSRRNITTKSLSSFGVMWKDLGSSANHVVNVGTKLTPNADSGTLSPEDTANSIKRIELRLYQGNYIENIGLVQPIATRSFYNTEDFNLKTNFYDNQYSVTTDETFGMDIDSLRETNDGKLSEYYTVMISAYYDVEGNNEVRIDDDKKVTAYKISPELLMENVEDPKIKAEPIKKMDSELEFNLLNGGTVVGYDFWAYIDRSGLIANHLIPQKIYVYVYDEDGNRVQFRDSNYNLTNNLVANLDEGNSYATKIYMDYGTDYYHNDTVMARGNKYYIGYVIELEGENGTVNYPSNTGTVGGDYGMYTDVETEKEAPTSWAYIAKSTANNITYRYEIKDPDHAIYKENDANNFGYYYVINDGVEQKLNLVASDGEYPTYRGDVVIPGLHNSDVYKLYYKVNTTKTGVISNDIYNYSGWEDDGWRLFDGFYDLTSDGYNFKYKVINNPLVDNKVMVKILADDSVIDRILYYQVRFADTKGHVVEKETNGVDLKLLPCNDGLDDGNRCLIVDYMALKDMKSTEGEENTITVSVKAYYDNGLTGFDYTVGDDKDYSYMIFQDNHSDDTYGSYMVYTRGGVFAPWTDEIDMPKGYYRYNKLSNMFTYTSQFNNTSKTIRFTLGPLGYMSGTFALNPKMVVSANMTSNEKTFSFNSITPKVAISDTTPIINGAVLDFNLTGADIEDFCEETAGTNCVNTTNGNKYVYVEVWDSEDDIGNLENVVRPTVKVKVNNNNPLGDLRAVVDKLSNGTTYYYHVYAYLNKNGRKVYTQLFDDATSLDEYKVKTYNFTSLISSDIYRSYELNYKPNETGAYSDKLLNTRINLSSYGNSISYNYDITYAICNETDETCGIGEGNTNIFKKTISMNELTDSVVSAMDISLYDLEFDKDYQIQIYAIFDYYNPETNTIVKKNLLLNRINPIVNLRKLVMPEFVVSREATYVGGDYVIDFGINVKDPDRTLVDGEYFIKLTDTTGNMVGDLQVRGDDDGYITVATNGNYENYVFDAKVINRNIRIKGLNENTKYTILVYSQAYVNNYSVEIPKSERTFDIEKKHTVYSSNETGVAFGKELLFSPTEHSVVVTFLGGSNFDNVKEVTYTVGLWDNEQATATHSGSYLTEDKKFEMFKDTSEWRYVIDPEGMTNVLGQVYTVALGFYVENPDTGIIEYYDSADYPEFAGRVQYVKDNDN